MALSIFQFYVVLNQMLDQMSAHQLNSTTGKSAHAAPTHQVSGSDREGSDVRRCSSLFTMPDRKQPQPFALSLTEYSTQAIQTPSTSLMSYIC